MGLNCQFGSNLIIIVYIGVIFQRKYFTSKFFYYDLLVAIYFFFLLLLLLLLYYFFYTKPTYLWFIPFHCHCLQTIIGRNKDNECVHEDKFLSTYIEPYKSKINVPSCWLQSENIQCYFGRLWRRLPFSVSINFPVNIWLGTLIMFLQWYNCTLLSIDMFTVMYGFSWPF
jgi:hypothetical protein